MQTRDFLFELGVEEIPAGYLAGAVFRMEELFRKGLTEKKLSWSCWQTFCTPRRLALKITGLPLKQNDEISEKIGPAQSAAFAEDGSLTKAALGFLNGVNAKPDAIYLVDSPKGKKIAIKKEIAGLETSEILKQIISDIVNIPFPKSMKWGSSQLSFARPIRWLLVLWGNDVIDMKINGLDSGRISLGNRFQKLENRLEINAIEEYEPSLEKAFVIADRQRRKRLIEEQLNSIFSTSGEQIVPDENLLEIVTDLVEYPTAVVAGFQEKYLQLPQKVITSTLSQHQKYFAVLDASDRITNKFVFISNGDQHYSDLIRLGNEKVITARLEDAGFFYQEDTKVALESFVPKLAEVTFQEKLGTLLDKTERLRGIVEYFGKKIAVDPHTLSQSLRAAFLCKADLVTQMLGEKEFTKLQGYIGREYALQSSETQEVADAIYEHYLPRGERDILPESVAGAIVAVADKMDTVCGIIGVDMIPTGSKDPFALRRSANGIVQIIDKFQFEISLRELIEKTFEILKPKLPAEKNNIEFVTDFFRQRAEWLLKQKNIDYDVIESVMHIDHNNIPDLVHRAEALQNFKKQEDFHRLVLGFKRVSNIIAEFTDISEVQTGLFEDEAEKNLHANYLILAENISELLKTKSYEKILEKLVHYGRIIDRFFDDVLVNTENNKLRLNRQRLLFQIRNLFLRVADISKIVVEYEK